MMLDKKSVIDLSALVSDLVTGVTNWDRFDFLMICFTLDLGDQSLGEPQLS